MTATPRRCSAPRRCWRATRPGPARCSSCSSRRRRAAAARAAMIADGLFERFPMERIFGYHNWPGLEAGTVAVHDAAVMAAGGRMEFRVTGSLRARRAAASDARPDGCVGASVAGAADDRFTQRRSAGFRGDHRGDDAGRQRGQPDPRRGGDARHDAHAAQHGARPGGGCHPPGCGGRGAELRRDDRRGAPSRQPGDGELAGGARPGGRGGGRGRVCRCAGTCCRR